MPLYWTHKKECNWPIKWVFLNMVRDSSIIKYDVYNMKITWRGGRTRGVIRLCIRQKPVFDFLKFRREATWYVTIWWLIRSYLNVSCKNGLLYLYYRIHSYNYYKIIKLNYFWHVNSSLINSHALFWSNS